MIKQGIIYARAWAEWLGGTKMRFHYPCGHTSVKDWSKGKITKRIPETGVRMMASWWSQEKGGCIATCPKCDPRKKKPRDRLPPPKFDPRKKA